MDHDDLLRDTERIKSQIPLMRLNLGVLLACTVGLACVKWYFCALFTLFAARFFFGLLCSYKDFLRWADMERDKQQQIEDLRPRK